MVVRIADSTDVPQGCVRSIGLGRLYWVGAESSLLPGSFSSTTDMGIKFRCPNGHKLHVKVFLAGKRGICPKCSAKFNIPTTSGGQVAAVGESLPTVAAPDPTDGIGTPKMPSSAASSIIHTSPREEIFLPRATAIQSPTVAPLDGPAPTQAAAPAPAPKSVPAPGDPRAEATDALWYVRPASGGQFGPADGDVLQQWLNEGRIAENSFLWHDGWAGWQKAGEVFPHLAEATRLSEGTSPSRASSASTSPIGHRKSGRRKSKQSALMLTVFLFLTVLVLMIVLWFVFWLQSG